MADSHRLALLCGGGPAPGINSVIGAATIRATLAGTSVVGIRDGFKWLMQGDTEHAVPLTIEAVSRIHFTGGSYLGISRANPTKDQLGLTTLSYLCATDGAPMPNPAPFTWNWVEQQQELNYDGAMAVNRSDFPVIKAVTVYLAILTMLINLLVDVMYKYVDPRVSFK